MVFQIFLKVADDSGVDAETSGECCCFCGVEGDLRERYCHLFKHMADKV